MCRSAPLGSGGARWIGGGSLMAARARDTLPRSARTRPTRPLAPAAATATEPVTRNCRRRRRRRACRAGQPGARRRRRRAGRRAAVAPRTRPGPLCRALPRREPPAGPATPRRRSAGESPASSCAARTSRHMANSPAAPPTSEGSTSAALRGGAGQRGDEADRGEHAQARPRRSGTGAPPAMPITAANTASSTRIPVTSAVLSFEPNVEIAKSFTGGGVRSMLAWPTATTGEPTEPVRPATSWPTPSATAAVIRPVNRPVTTPGRVRGRPGGGDCGSEDTVTSSIRCRHRQGLAAGGRGPIRSAAGHES